MYNIMIYTRDARKSCGTEPSHRRRRTIIVIVIVPTHIIIIVITI